MAPSRTDDVERGSPLDRDPPRGRLSRLPVMLLAALALLSASACGSQSIRIEAQPASLTVNVCSSARFTVVASATSSIAYQWYRDGQPIPGANASVLEIPIASVTDSGRRFFAVLESEGGSTRSDAAVFTVVGRPKEPVLLAPTGAGQLAVDGDTIYWTDWEGVYAAPIECGRPVRTLYRRGSPDEYPAPLTLDGHDVYWGDGTLGFVARVSALGGAPTLIAQTTNSVGLIAIAGGAVYWTGWPNAAIFWKSLDGGPIGVQWLDVPYGVIMGMALDETAVYWGEGQTRAIYRMPLGGGTPVVLASGPGIPSSVAADGGHVYWISTVTDSAGAQTSEVSTIPRDGGDVRTLATVSGGAYPIALDSTHVYWAGWAGTGAQVNDVGGWSVYRAPRASVGAMEVVAAGLTSASGLALDDGFVYIGEHPLLGIGRMLKVAK